MLDGVCCPSSSQKRRIVELLLVGAGFRRCSPEIEMRQHLVAVAGVGSLLLVAVLRRSLLPGGPAKREKKKNKEKRREERSEREGEKGEGVAPPGTSRRSFASLSH